LVYEILSYSLYFNVDGNPFYEVRTSHSKVNEVIGSPSKVVFSFSDTKILNTIMLQSIRFLLICLSILFLIQRSTIYAETCLHNERSKCTQVRNTNEITSEENNHCHHLCIHTGHASGHCSLSNNCFQYCLCNEKEL
jgi:hypothetical protein